MHLQGEQQAQGGTSRRAGELWRAQISPPAPTCSALSSGWPSVMRLHEVVSHQQAEIPHCISYPYPGPCQPRHAPAEAPERPASCEEERCTPVGGKARRVVGVPGRSSEHGHAS